MSRYCTIIALLFTGCISLVEDSFPPPVKSPVINSILVVNDTVKVQISHITGLTELTSTTSTDNAFVQLWESEVLKDTLHYNVQTRLYESDFIARAQTTYRLKVKIDSSEYNLEQTTPIAPTLYSVNQNERAGTTEEGLAYPSLEIQIGSEPEEEQYFQVLIHLLISEEITETAPLIFVEDPVILNEGHTIAVFSNELIKSETYKLHLNYSTNASNGYSMNLYPTVVELRTVSESYYHFLKRNYQYENTRYPEFGSGNIPAISNYTNVTGAYGVIGAYNSIASDTIYPKNMQQRIPVR